MLITVYKIKFQNQEFIIVDNAICTIQQFKNCWPGYAHLFEDGIIRRYGKQIGAFDDIDWLEEIEIEIDIFDFMNGIIC